MDKQTRQEENRTSRKASHICAPGCTIAHSGDRLHQPKVDIGAASAPLEEGFDEQNPLDDLTALVLLNSAPYKPNSEDEGYRPNGHIVTNGIDGHEKGSLAGPFTENQKEFSKREKSLHDEGAASASYRMTDISRDRNLNLVKRESPITPSSNMYNQTDSYTDSASFGDVFVSAPETPSHLSLEGQKARSYFCSSGYGTGSGESSKDKSASKSSVLSQENDLVEVPSQRTHNSSEDSAETRRLDLNPFGDHLANAPSANKDIVESVNHDMPEHSETTNGVLQTNNQFLRRKSKGTLAKLNAIHEDSLEISTQSSSPKNTIGLHISTNTSLHSGGLSSPDDGIQNLEMQPVITPDLLDQTSHLGEVAHNSTHGTSHSSCTTNSSKNSFCVSATGFETQHVDHCIDSLKVLFERNACSERTVPKNVVSTNSASNLQISVSSDDRFFPKDDQRDSMDRRFADYTGSHNSLSLTSMLQSFEANAEEGSVSKRDLMCRLESCGRCTDLACSSNSCFEMKNCLEQTRDPSVPLNYFTCQLLLCVYRHSVDCVVSKPRCPFHWCVEDVDVHEQLNELEAISKMKEHFEAFVDDVFDGLPVSSHDVKFLKLDPSLPFQRVPELKRDFRPLTCLFHCKQTILAKPIFGTGYWVLAKVPESSHESGDLKLYDRLGQAQCRQNAHSGIVRFLWAAHLPTCHSILTCHLLSVSPLGTQYVSLQDYIGGSTMDKPSVMTVMAHLVSATQFLHKLRILYLNWSGSSVAVCPPASMSAGMHVQLWDFSAAVLEDDTDLDSGHLRCMLAPHLHPPELLSQRVVCFASDVWGLGCMLYHMVTSVPVWHHLRHERVTELQKQMKHQPQPDFPQDIDPVLQKMLKDCWQVDPNKRSSLEELAMRLKRNKIYKVRCG